MCRDLNGIRLTVLPLSVPVVILANHSRGFYIHCSTHHDDSIHYQTYYDYAEVIAQDKNMVLFPGQARCGPGPFGAGKGRWRNIRGFCGTVIYRALKRAWTPKRHMEFPASFREIVLLLLMMWDRPDCTLNVLPKESIFVIIQFMDWDWFEDEEELVSSERSISPSKIRRGLEYFYY